MVALTWYTRVRFECLLLQFVIFLGRNPIVSVFDTCRLHLLATFAIPTGRLIENLSLKLAKTHQLLECCEMPLVKCSIFEEFLQIKGLYENEVAALNTVLDARHSDYNFIIFIIACQKVGLYLVDRRLHLHRLV